MAIIKNGKLSGLVGNVVSYTANGREIYRARPKRKPKQSKATKARALEFGNIKRLSSRLRFGLWDLLPDYRAKSVMFPMDAAVRRWYNECYLREGAERSDPSFFQQLQLNSEASPFAKTWLGTEPAVDWSKQDRITLHIPTISKEKMFLPNHATDIRFTFLVAGAPMNDPYRITLAQHWTSNQIIEKTLGPKEIESFSMEINDLERRPDSLYLAWLFLSFKRNKQWIEEEKWKPVVVVGSWFTPSAP
jgi:hypothetical protein